jgi:hypothetical protein
MLLSLVSTIRSDHVADEPSSDEHDLAIQLPPSLTGQWMVRDDGQLAASANHQGSNTTPDSASPTLKASFA